MRILLDESLPRPLRLALIGHEASTVRDESWTSLTNGALLGQAAERFDVLLTADQNIEFQQNLVSLPIAVVILVAESNRLESLEPLVPDVLDASRAVETEFTSDCAEPCGPPPRAIRNHWSGSALL